MITLSGHDSHVQVNGLTKRYRVPVRAGGFAASVRGLFRREYRTVEAVRSVSFTIQAGEVVGFLGPNGAGKTTTLKMLAGLLYPTAGEARVLGCEPWRRDPAYLRQMTLVMGQKSQLIWDIPAMDTFLLNQAIYGNMFDGGLPALVQKMAPFKVLHVVLSEALQDGLAHRYGEVIASQDGKLTLKVPKERTPEITSRILAELPVTDLTVEDPPIEDVIDRVFQKGVGPA